MARLADRIAARLGYVPRARAFAAADTAKRLLASWTRQNTSIDYDLHSSLSILRARSRDLTQNVDFGRRFLQVVRTHVIGPQGFTLQSQVRFRNGQLDKGANNAIEEAFAEWAKTGVCEVSGKFSLLDVQNLLITAAARDGEYLVRKVFSDVNPFRFALQILDVDRLDIERNERQLANGNQIVMGVEMTRYQRPVAYWLLTSHPGGNEGANLWQKWERVPVGEIYHGFIPERPEQTRGVPWMHAVLERAKHLSAYNEAAVVAARTGAAKMGWFASPDGVGSPLADGMESDGTLYTEATPGQFGVLPPGYTFQTFDPDYPHQAYDAFIKACLRGISSGLGVAYHTLASDLEGVNFSSARQGTLEERDEWMRLQGWFADTFLAPMFSDWLMMALLSGQVKLPNGAALPVDKFPLYNRPYWQGRRWSWVDPEKDVNAAVIAVTNGFKTRRQIIRESGAELEDVWQGLADEQKLAESLGLELGEAEKKEKPPIVKEEGEE